MISYGRFFNRFNQVKDFRTTRLGLRVYRDRLDERMDPRGRPYFWIGGDTSTDIPEDGTDIGALSEGYVSLTPLQLDLIACDSMGWIKKSGLDVNTLIKNRLHSLNLALLEC